MTGERLDRIVAELVDRYFGAEAPRQQLEPGAVLMRAGDRNQRLFYVLEGDLLLRSEHRTEVRVGRGNLVGIQSVFLAGFTSVWTVVAESPSTLGWVDLGVPCPSGRPWEVELMPLVMAELNHRQERVREMQERQRLVEQRLQELTYISTLGQMAAGVAHELNNALSVLSRGSEWIAPVVQELAAPHPSLQRRLLALGLEAGHHSPPGDAAALAARLRKRGLGLGAARRLASLPLPPDLLDEVLAAEDREEVLRFFELGATLCGMTASARQAAHVVTSLKQLAARERLRDEEVDLAESIEVAVSICRNALKGITLTIDHGADQTVQGNQGELVQVWTNLIQNACDALHQHPPSQPRIRIGSHSAGGKAVVVISDNGPGIDPAIVGEIFKPHVSTKQQGLHFGLGLGLSIVQQTVRRYGGTVHAEANRDGGASFIVALPHRMGPTTRWVLQHDAPPDPLDGLEEDPS